MEKIVSEKDRTINEIVEMIEKYEQNNPLAQLNATGVKILINQLKTQKWESFYYKIIITLHRSL